MINLDRVRQLQEELREEFRKGREGLLQEIEKVAGAENISPRILLLSLISEHYPTPTEEEVSVEATPKKRASPKRKRASSSLLPKYRNPENPEQTWQGGAAIKSPKWTRHLTWGELLNPDREDYKELRESLEEEGKLDQKVYPEDN